MLPSPDFLARFARPATLAGIGLSAALALASVSCGTGGEESRGGMSGLPGAGLGPYRRLDTDELSGRLALRRMALVESGMVLRGAGPQPLMFYAAADLPPDPPPMDAGMDADGGVDPDAGVASDGGADLDAGTDAGTGDPLAGFLPRRILRSNPGEGPGYVGGELVLEAREAWEGDAVYDPWAVRLADGRVRLYYAAAGGIGIAESDSATGTFTRVGTGPVLAGLRRPTIAARPDRAPGFLLYAEREGAIVLAESADGLTFGTPEPVDLGFMASDAGVPQIAVGSPGAGLQIPTLDPPRVVLFFESRRADGSRTLGIAASRDGRNFERATLPAFGMGLAEGFPAPDFIDAQTTLLYFTVAATTEDRPSRALTVAVSPGTLRFD
jgi:hypothetical protein